MDLELIKVSGSKKRLSSRARRALVSSIISWEVDKLINLEYAGRVDCALCLLYNEDTNCLLYNEDMKQMPSSCKLCPIAQESGYQYCYNTPYIGYNECWRSFMDGEEVLENRVKAKEYAQEMIDFMKGILKKRG